MGKIRTQDIKTQTVMALEAREGKEGHWKNWAESDRKGEKEI